MDKHLCFARTEKGRAELLGASKSLKPRARQVLFLVGDTISVDELKQKLPTCQELEKILEQLWEEGYIGQVKASKPSHKTDAALKSGDPASTPLEAARELALRVLATLAGEQSPIYAQVKNAPDMEAFIQAVAAGKKVLAAVASSAQANAFEHSVLAILPSQGTGDAPAAAQINGIESAKGRALEIICSLVGDRSPVYAKVNGAHNRADFIDAVGAGKKVIAAVASASHAQSFESEVLGMLEDH